MKIVMSIGLLLSASNLFAMDQGKTEIPNPTFAFNYVYQDQEYDGFSSEEEEEDQDPEESCPENPEQSAAVEKFKSTITQNINSASQVNYQQQMNMITSLLEELSAHPELSAQPFKQFLRETILKLKSQKKAFSKSSYIELAFPGLPVEQSVAKGLEPNRVLLETTYKLLSAENHLRFIQLFEQRNIIQAKKECLIKFHEDSCNRHTAMLGIANTSKEATTQK